MRHREGGQGLVEFALVIPIFLFIIFTILQLGLLFQAQNGLTNAVRETARYAAPFRVVDTAGATTTCSTVLSKLTTILSQEIIGYTAANEIPTATYTWKADENLDGNYYITIKVKADYKFPLFVPLISNLLDGMDGVADVPGPKLRLSAQEEMRVENDPQASSSSAVTCP